MPRSSPACEQQAAQRQAKRLANSKLWLIAVCELCLLDWGAEASRGEQC